NPEEKIRACNNYEPYGLKQLPDGQLIVIGWVGKPIEKTRAFIKKIVAKIYDPSTYACTKIIVIEENINSMLETIQMEILSDGLLAISINNTIRIWDIGFRPVSEATQQLALSTPVSLNNPAASTDTSSNDDTLYIEKPGTSLKTVDPFPSGNVTSTLEFSSNSLKANSEHPGSSLRVSQESLLTPIDAAVPTIPLSAIKIDYATRLGSGGYADVFKGTWGATDVAVKKFQTTVLGEKTLSSFQNEAKRHYAFKHPNVVMLYGITFSPDQYFMIMAKMSCSLRDLLLGNIPLTNLQKYSIAFGSAEGICYLHENGTIHRDLKSGNILIDIDKGFHPQIADFGISEIKSEIENQKSLAGTTSQVVTGSPRWMAPELFKNWPCTVQTDIYAFGVVLWEILTRKTPFADANNYEVIRRVKRGEREIIPEKSPVAYVNLLQGCWQQDPTKRPQEIRLIANALRLFKVQQTTREELHLKEKTSLLPVQADFLDDFSPGFRYKK
ncbi:MAG: serine/threonine kinase, partial [Gammaproteobacteria bacterium]